MKRWYNSKIMYFIGAIFGAVSGYLYWKQIGCVSGTCSITSSPVNSTIYGAILGSLLFGLFVVNTKSKKA
jgi:hypothetical protein